MNLLLLVVTASTILRGWWIPVSALLAFSVEMQIGAFVGVGLHGLLLINAVITAAALAIRGRCALDEARRGRHVLRVYAGEIGAALRLKRNWTIMGLWLAFVLIYAGFGVGELLVIDPYHFLRIDWISAHGLTFNPTPDSRMNAGYLYELIAADIRIIPGVGGSLFQFVPLWSLIGVAALIVIAMQGQYARFWLWGNLLFLPLLLLHGRYFKNDLLLGALAFGALWLIYERKRLFLAGALAGLALATKTTAFPVVIIGALFLPYGAAFLTTRLRFGAGAALGAIAGGLLYTQAVTLAGYGEALDAVQVGYMVRTVESAILSLRQFAESVLLPQMASSGHNDYTYILGFGFLFPALVAVYVALAITERLDWQLGAMCALYMLLFAASYNLSYQAQRMVIAPGLVLMIVTLRAVPKRWERTVGGAAAISTAVMVGLTPAIWAIWGMAFLV